MHDLFLLYLKKMLITLFRYLADFDPLLTNYYFVKYPEALRGNRLYLPGRV